MDAITIVNIPSATGDSKIILVINISPTKFNLDGNMYCDTGMVFPYRLIYVRIENFEEISVDICVNLVKSLNILTDGICIYMIDDKDVRKGIVPFINRLNFSNTIVMNNSTHTDIGREFDSESPLNIKKFINFRLQRPDEWDYMRHKHGNSFIATFPRVGQSFNLFCQHWFQYSVDLLCGCAKGRIFQISGTCYLNAIVNGFILSKPCRNILLNKMKELIYMDYKKPLNLDICERKTENYFFQLLYGVLCSKEPLRRTVKESDDIMIEYSKLYGTVDKDSGVVTGEGGLPRVTMKNICGYLNSLLGDNIFYTQTSRGLSPVKIIIDSREYTRQFTVINLSNYEEDFHHSVTGFVCDGIYKIYDSGENYITTINWVSNMHQILSNNNQEYNVINSTTSLYVANDILESNLVYLSTQQLCDQL